MIRAWFDHRALAAAMGLGADQQLLLAQTVGLPAAPAQTWARVGPSLGDHALHRGRASMRCRYSPRRGSVRAGRAMPRVQGTSIST